VLKQKRDAVSPIGAPSDVNRRLTQRRGARQEQDEFYIKTNWINI